ncbi:MAG: flagellar motor protein MotB [Legionella sp.]|nr:flagellar motor protein MotB [Legionella sp.]
MTQENQPIIVIKKINKSKKEHHGGSWKIAYADFVTAMMAFFMLLWLLSLLNKYQLQGISAYFKKPLSDVFVGSKNAEQYKNQNDHKVIEIKSDVGGGANSDLKQDKKMNVSANPEAAKDKNEKSKDSSADTAKDKASQAKAQSTNQEKEQIKAKLELALQKNVKASAFKDNLSFEVVKDGVKVSLHDSTKNQMFSLGKADFKNYTKNIVDWLSKEFNHIPKKIIIIGHTDTYPYDVKAQYTNWELSTDRANAVRRLLILRGMDPAKIIRVEGAASVSLLDDKNGDNPINRRVEIIVLTDEAAQRLIEE